MWFKIFIVVLCSYAIAVAAQNTCGVLKKSNAQTNPPQRGAWPWIASLHTLKDDNFICGGTLIGLNMVITAAHCIQEKDSPTPRHPTDIVVKLGKHDLAEQYERGSETKYVDAIIVHPRWKYFTKDYDADIAIIILETKARVSDYISPICMWDENLEPKDKRGTVVGWGKSDFEGKLPRTMEVSMRTEHECFAKNPRFQAISSSYTFCAGKDAGPGPCSGDSGSGLFMRSDSQYFIRGIVSSGFLENGTCSESVDVVFTNIYKYSKWINHEATVHGISLPKLKPSSDPTKLGPRKFNKEIYCFFESWAYLREGDGAFHLDHLKPELCTTLVMLHAELEGDTLKSLFHWHYEHPGGIQLFKHFNGLKRTYRHLKTLLSVGSWNEGSTKYSQLAADPERRKKFAENAAEFVKKYGFDGLHFHWEYPAHRGGSRADKANFVLLLKDIHDVFKPQNLILTVFTRTQTKVVEKAYDLRNIVKYVDAVMMMSFDLAGFEDKKVGYPAALYGNDENNVDSRVNYFLAQGVPPEKIVLGLPFFGRTFVTRGNAGNIGDASESAFSGPFFTEIGFLGYNEQCNMRLDSQWETSFDPRASQAIAKFRNNSLTHVVAYDSTRSIANKIKYMSEKNLAGAWVWFVDSDDFRSECQKDESTFNDFPNKPPATRQPRDFPLMRTILQTLEFLTSG